MASFINDKSVSIFSKFKNFSFISTGNYPYVCARVRAKRAFLLSKDIYSKLMVMDVHQIARFLGESQYKKEISELGMTYSGFELTELSLNRNMALVYNQILGYCEGDLYNMLSAYLMREDIWNIKTILRGKYHNAKSDEILKSIIPAGKYSENYWNKIIQNSKSYDEVIQNLEGNEFYETLKSFEGEYKSNPSDYENLLEKVYYNFLINTIRLKSEPNKIFLDFIRKEIDLINLKTLLMTKFENVESDKINKMIIEGGNINEKYIQILVNTPDFKQFLEELQKLPGYEIIRDNIKSIIETNILNYFIRSLEKDFLIKATRSSYLHPLSILPILDFVIRKKIEVENLRIIVRGKEKGLSEQKLRELLVI